MTTNIAQLYNISNKNVKRIIGLMSGTSLDGLDVALCSVKNSGPNTEVKLENFTTIPYSQEEKENIKKVFPKTRVNLQELCLLNEWIGKLHGKIVLECLRSWNIPSNEIDLIASHGQTIFHAPKSFHGLEGYDNSTLQLGDGDQIAILTGIITVSDFRQRNVAAGGEGAPLALFGDYCMFSCTGKNRLLLNMGGISNFTVLYGDSDPKKAFATDLGPGNTLIDHFAKLYFNKEFDENGEIARRGTVNDQLLEALKSDPFFALPIPKTTGQEKFNEVFVKEAQSNSSTLDISPQDLIATLTKFTADTIIDSIRKIQGYENFEFYVSGGGAHNSMIMEYLRSNLKVNIETSEGLGIPGDAKEAVLFAVLANELVSGSQIDYGNRPEIPSVSMGKICFPK